MVHSFKVFHDESKSILISARLPENLVIELDVLAKQTKRKRNQLITMAIEYALNRLEIVHDQKNL